MKICVLWKVNDCQNHFCGKYLKCNHLNIFFGVKDWVKFFLFFLSHFHSPSCTHTNNIPISSNCCLLSALLRSNGQTNGPTNGCRFSLEITVLPRFLGFLNLLHTRIHKIYIFVLELVRILFLMLAISKSNLGNRINFFQVKHYEFFIILFLKNLKIFIEFALSFYISLPVI